MGISQLFVARIFTVDGIFPYFCDLHVAAVQILLCVILFRNLMQFLTELTKSVINIFNYIKEKDKMLYVIYFIMAKQFSLFFCSQKAVSSLG